MKDVKGKNLPENTTYVESFSAAGKLQGNGNGMQYLGGIVIKSDLSVDEIKEYYKQYANEDWEFIVEKQEGQRVLASEHKDINIKAEITSNNYYVVYTWGSSDSIFAFFDIRGN